MAFLAASAFCSGTETALTALGEPRARQLRETGGRRARLLGLWIDHPERVLSTLLIGNTLVNVGAGALAGSVGADLAGGGGWAPGTLVAIATGVTTVVILFAGEIVPKTIGKRHPAPVALWAMPMVQALCLAMWPLSAAVTRLTGWVVGRLGGGRAPTPAVTSEEIEYLIEMGTREGVLDEVKEELLNSVLEFADRVAKEVMIPRTRMVAVDRAVEPDELVRIVTENPYSRMPVYEGSIDNVVGILLVRDIIQELRHGPLRRIALDRYLKPAFFVPEQMKISRLLKEMQRRRTHLAVVVDEFGGTSGLVTMEDVIEEIVGEIQDEADVESAPVKAVAPGVWLADAAIPLHDLQSFLNEQREEPAPRPAGDDAPEPEDGEPPPEIRFPEQGDYETLGGFVTATAGRVPPVGATLAWDGLTFTVRAGDERRVTRVEIARRGEVAAPEVAPAAARS
ncbi:hemolysin family protein [Anaeromyxobacter dehalogenans]|uniref:hemolysin family protein n=1 Tax=Anaeromyxobacter dehalogenans TaxID=161493 RepID=UPI0002F4F8C3|nr:hemolysin family protein [Anaeromyxobacter dehalogenans]